MFHYKAILAFSILLVVLNGCTTKSADLQLENIFDLKAERAQRAAIKAAKNAKIREEEARSKDEDLKKKEQKSAELSAKISAEDPPELALFELPEIFVRSKNQKKMAAWYIPNLDVTIMVWKNLTDAKKVKAMSQEELKNELKNVGKQYNTFFEETRKSPATFKIMEDGNCFVLKVKSNYLDFQDWFTQTRYVFFYRPDYRLNLLVVGRDEHLEKINPELEKAIELFRKRLRENFKNGTKTSIEQVDRTNQKPGV